MWIIRKILRRPEPEKVVSFISVTSINAKAAEKLRKTLQMIKPKSTDALCISINHLNGGQLVQAELMGLMLQRKAKELEVPLITYAEDYAFATGYHLLMHGDVHLANPCSMLGNIGHRITPLMLKNFLADYEIKLKYVHKGENKVRLNRFEEFTEKDKQWMLNIMNKRVAAMVEFACSARNDKATVKDLQNFRSVISQGKYHLGEEALELGLVDELTTPEEYFTKHFTGYKMNIQIPEKDIWQTLGIEKSQKESIYSKTPFIDAAINMTGLNQLEIFEDDIEIQELIESKSEYLCAGFDKAFMASHIPKI